MFKHFIYYLIHTVACLVLSVNFRQKSNSRTFFLSFRSFIPFFRFFLSLLHMVTI